MLCRLRLAQRQVRQLNTVQETRTVLGNKRGGEELNEIGMCVLYWQRLIALAVRPIASNIADRIGKFRARVGTDLDISGIILGPGDHTSRVMRLLQTLKPTASLG